MATNHTHTHTNHFQYADAGLNQKTNKFPYTIHLRTLYLSLYGTPTEFIIGLHGSQIFFKTSPA